MPITIQEQFGQIDIYVFDQILRGNIAAPMRVLDAGCGYGRNLVHLLREGCDVFALDEDPAAVDHVRQLSASLQTGLPAENFQVGPIEHMPFPRRLRGRRPLQLRPALCPRRPPLPRHAGRVVARPQPGGMLFCRLGSRIGMDFHHLRDNIYRVGDGSEWFLVDQQMLLDLTEELNAVLVDPLKTTIVQDYRCMTTWVLRKRTGTVI